MYNVRSEYFIRIHHVRPRFKGDIENVLIYLASEISKIQIQASEDFANKVNSSIFLFPGNVRKTLKTINNWRTEISSLFGFIIDDGMISRAGLRAIELADKEDLVEAFKKFLFTFQYPGAHIKSHEIKKLIESGVNFKPAQYLLKLLLKAEEISGKRISITKGEFCHCVLNDLRCCRDNQDPIEVWSRIKQNRDNFVVYDLGGDIIRYAGDIIDYMEIANLLVTYDNIHYYQNNLESDAILKFVNSTEWFKGYDVMIRNRHATLQEINMQKFDWFTYVNRDMSKTDFATDILAFISTDKSQYEQLIAESDKLLQEKLSTVEPMRTKDIGDIGENMVLGHEFQRVKEGGRVDLIHIIKRIPTQFAVGYDIQSVELDVRKRYIEVKTTISSKPIQFNKIHLTTNEWNTANTTKDRYFIYRLMISKNDKKLFIIQDPVNLYKESKIDMIPKDGAELMFDPNTIGYFEEVLVWKG